jgi:hypothetical protein
MAEESLKEKLSASWLILAAGLGMGACEPTSANNKNFFHLSIRNEQSFV